MYRHEDGIGGFVRAGIGIGLGLLLFKVMFAVALAIFGLLWFAVAGFGAVPRRVLRGILITLAAVVMLFVCLLMFEG